MSGFEIAVLALGATSTLFQVAAKRAETEAGVAEAGYKKAVFANRAAFAAREAKNAQLRGAEESRILQAQTASTLGDIPPGFARHGVLAGEDSALDRYVDIAGIGQHDLLNQAYNTEVEVAAARQKEQDHLASVGLFGAQARSIERTGGRKAAASLLSGSFDVASKWHGFRQARGEVGEEIIG